MDPLDPTRRAFQSEIQERALLRTTCHISSTAFTVWMQGAAATQAAQDSVLALLGGRLRRTEVASKCRARLAGGLNSRWYCRKAQASKSPSGRFVYSLAKNAFWMRLTFASPSPPN